MCNREDSACLLLGLIPIQELTCEAGEGAGLCLTPLKCEMPVLQ